MPASIHQEVIFAATPERIYAALTTASQFSEITNAPADIDPEVGGAFTAFAGMISGINVEMVPGRRLVQAWRVANWDEGVYSIVKFELLAEGGGTRLVFDHAGFPEAAQEHLDSGWHKMYWQPLRKSLAP